MAVRGRGHEARVSGVVDTRAVAAPGTVAVWCARVVLGAKLFAPIRVASFCRGSRGALMGRTVRLGLARAL